ncbi:MAG: 4Fe-4S binding protein, partial [Actinomycetes bacterium]
PVARRREAGGWKAARWVRRAVQIAVLVFFIYLLFAALQRRAAFPHADFFFRLDPLAAFGTMLAARQWLPHLALALVTVGTALVLGRVWCGWICPLGTLLGWFRFRAARRLAPRLPPRLRSVKYVLLGVIVVMAALGSLTLLVLDPIALLTRTFTTSLIPGFDYVVGAVESAVLSWGLGSGAVIWIEDHFRGTVLPVYQPRYAQGVAIFLVFLAVVLLNVFAERFWCRYLCPLGALLGLVAKVQVLRPLVGAGCNGCNACVRACRVDAIEAAGSSAGAGASGRSEAADARARVICSECTMCLDCLVACPEREAMSFGPTLKPGPWAVYDPGRRQFLAAAAIGVGTVALLGTSVARAIKAPGLIRPPGAQDEGAFLSRCLRCSECMKVCPTSGLQASLGQGGLEAIWTPVLASRLGYCDYSCTACGHVCPSGAIPKLDLETKRKRVIGVAVIDRNRCLPWASNTPCIVCQEMCPISNKAIVLSDRRLITRPDGTQDYLARPKVVAKRCIGCGICEYKCPLEGTSAIVVLPSNPSLAVGGVPSGSAYPEG